MDLMSVFTSMIGPQGESMQLEQTGRNLVACDELNLK